MGVKLLVVLIALTLAVNLVVADFFYNHPSPKSEDLFKSDFGYICVPGRTTIKITERKAEIEVPEPSDSDEYRLRERPARDTRKRHMNIPTQDEYCQMCVCSADGKDEHCSNRPAANLNECLMMEEVKEKFKGGLPFDLSRDLSNRIRRGLSWSCRCR